MSREVWKYDLGETLMTEGDVVDMPFGSRVLDVREQGGHACIWAEASIDKDTLMLPRSFLVVMTGEAIPDAAQYVGTIHTLDGNGAPYVVHVYEATSNPRGVRSSRSKDDLREALASADERGRMDRTPVILEEE